jgi:hypothetical protein
VYTLWLKRWGEHAGSVGKSYIAFGILVGKITEKTSVRRREERIESDVKIYTVEPLITDTLINEHLQ